MARWNELDAYEGPWVDVFVLMWEAYSGGSIPGGAVVCDEPGRIVIRGRNRIFEAAVDGEVGDSRLAHAEANALLGLSSERTYEGWTLYSALEPCHFCMAAAYSARVGTVRYACRDAYGGAVGKLLPSQDQRAHPVAVEGPLDGVAGLLPELLLVAHCLWRRRDGDTVRFYRDERPEVLARARELPPPDAGASLPEVFASVRARQQG